MVRLKAYAKIQQVVFLEFQFHYGTIKSVINFAPALESFLFQFHYGTIKRYNISRSLLLFTDFNSTMVRLKAFFILPLPWGLMYFNSTMVRLKGIRIRDVQAWDRNFNSTMVRLKGDYFVMYVCGVSIFQFHYGTIKSMLLLNDAQLIIHISIPLWYD